VFQTNPLISAPDLLIKGAWRGVTNREECTPHPHTTIKGCCPMSIIISEIYNSIDNTSKDQELDRLFIEYDNLYREALILKEDPESVEYQCNKQQRESNLDKQLKLARG